MTDRIAVTDADATAILGPKCPTCGWRRGQHRPAAPAMGLEPCPDERTEST